MSVYRIADLSVEINRLVKEDYDGYVPYLSDEIGEKPQIKLSTTREKIDYIVEKGVDFTPYTAENYLLAQQFHRVIQRFDGGHIHSSSVLYKGKVYLFSADSGVGKSTLTKRICRLYPDAVIINDDKPAFRIIDGKCIIYGTPFAGGTDIHRNMKAELGGIFFIERADISEISVMTSAEKITNLLLQTTRILNETASDKLLGLLSQIIEKYPIYKFSLTNDDTAANKVVSFINSGLI